MICQYVITCLVSCMHALCVSRGYVAMYAVFNVYILLIVISFTLCPMYYVLC